MPENVHISPDCDWDELDQLVRSGDIAAAVRVALERNAATRHRLARRLHERIAWLLDEPDAVSAGELLAQLHRLSPDAEDQFGPRIDEVAWTEAQRAATMHDLARIERLARLLLGRNGGEGALFHNLGCMLHGSVHVETTIALYRRAKRLGYGGAAINLAMVAGDAVLRDDAMAEIEGSPLSGVLPRIYCFRREFERARAQVAENFASYSHDIASSYVQAALQMLTVGSPRDALRLLHGAPPDLQAAPESVFLRTLLAWLRERLDRLPPVRSAASEPREIVCVGVCWGVDFARNFCALALRSLASAGNLPALSRKRKVTLRIFTDITGRIILKASPFVQTLAPFVQIEIETIPASILASANCHLSVGSGYLIFGVLQHVALLEAGRNGQDVIFLVGDGVYADGSFAHLGEVIENKPLAVIYSGFSALLPDVKGRLDAIFAPDAPIVINTFALADLAFRHIHPRTRQGVIARSQQLRTVNLSYLYFPTSWGLIERRITPDPLFVSNDLLREAHDLNFLTSDGELMDRLLPSRAAWTDVATIADNENMMVLELSENVKNTGEGDIGRITPSDVASYAGSRVHLGFMRHCFAAEYRFRGSLPPPWQGDDVYYREFTEALAPLLQPAWNTADH